MESGTGSVLLDLGEWAAAMAGAPAAIGGRVISWNYDMPVQYGGDDDGGYERLKIGVGSGGSPVLHCAPDRVAPADTVLADKKDPRIVVDKYPARRDRVFGVAGDWRLQIEGKPPTWFKTKGAAIAAGQRRLAILDYHRTNN